MICTYINPIINISTNKEQRLNILDLGVGEGGDLMKYFTGRAGESVGVDISSDNIYSAVSGALSRYNKFRK